MGQMGRRKYLYLIFWISLIVAAVGLSEQFGHRSDEEWEQEQLSGLRELAEESGDSFGYQMPADATPDGLPILGFDRVQRELDALGFDCTEVHRGIDQELFEAGIANACSRDTPTEVIVARFQRRT